jgi:hypothetical protein
MRKKLMFFQNESSECLGRAVSPILLLLSVLDIVTDYAIDSQGFGV